MPDPTTTTPSGITRRRLLGAALVVLLGPTGLPGCATPGSRADGSRAALLALSGDPAAVAWLGGAYLAAHPDEADGDHLADGLLQAVADELGRADLAGIAPAELADGLQRLVRSEYRRDEVVVVEHWLLSRSEARLYALASLPGD